MIGTKVSVRASHILPQDGIDVNVDLYSRMSVAARLSIAQEMRNILDKGKFEVGNFVNDTDFAKFYLSLFPSRKEAEQFIHQLMQHSQPTISLDVPKEQMTQVQADSKPTKNKWM